MIKFVIAKHIIITNQGVTSGINLTSGINPLFIRSSVPTAPLLTLPIPYTYKASHYVNFFILCHLTLTNDVV